jgi:hypothetical protein
MDRNKPIYLILLMLFVGTIACSFSGARQQAQTIEQTALALRTDIGGIITAGGSLIKTSQALETQHPGILETVKALATQGAPMISTIQAVATDNPGLVQTAQALIAQEIPTGEPPPDIPIINREKADNYFGSSQYIIYTSPVEYSQVLDFYKTEMPNNGWQFLESDSHVYANAAQLNYYKDTRTATINLSRNPLNNSSVVVINIITH